MPDLSFKCWHLAINCDHPAHRKIDPQCADYELVEPDQSKRAWLADMRSEGWIFHRDGRVTCPGCAKEPAYGRG